MKDYFGLTKPEFDLLFKLVIAPLQKQGATVWCFGSRARGDYSKFSDVDIMIESDQNLSSIINHVKEKIVESNFPYKVDLVDLRDFAKEYRLNFEREKILISP